MEAANDPIYSRMTPKERVRQMRIYRALRKQERKQ